MKETGKINYIEIPARDLEATKRFSTNGFGWAFVDYGPEYIASQIHNQYNHKRFRLHSAARFIGVTSGRIGKH